MWAGFLFSVVAFLSYTTVFVWYPLTRDFPWVNLLLFALATGLLIVGVRRAFTPERRLRSKIAASLLATLSVAMLCLFIFATLILGRWLPDSAGAPKPGQQAPEFSLSDSSGRPVSLSELLNTPLTNGNKPEGVLLIFYRGHW